MSNVAILLIGNVRRTEFGPGSVALAGAETVPTIDEALDRFAMDGQEPAVIVLAQSLPGQFGAADVERLRRGAPLARIVGLLGAWCEGESRSGTPWPAVTRWYWHQAPPRLGREQAALFAGDCPTWGLPVTTSEDERVLAATPLIAERPEPGCRGTIVIDADRAEKGDWLAAACRQGGFQALLADSSRVESTPHAAAAIWDRPFDTPEDVDRLRRLAQSVAPAPVIVLLDFPRTDDCDAALAAGAAAVLSKPLLLADLDAELRRHAPCRR